MESTGRRYLCAACRAAVLICSHCDRGNRYCACGCAQQARAASMRAAGRRYQASYRGRAAHAERQRRYRVRRHKVTHHGSLPLARPVEVATEPSALEAVLPPAWHCHVCRCPLPQFVRQDFLRSSVRRPPTRSDRSPHAHGAIP